MSANENIGELKNKKRIRKTYIIMALSAIVGFPFGIMIARISKGTLSLSPTALISGLILLTLAFVFLTWAWYKNMDEFERQGFHESGNIAFHTGFLALPWYILSEQGLLPSLNAAYLMIVLTLIFCVALIIKNGTGLN